MSRNALFDRLSSVRSEIELISFLRTVSSSFNFTFFAVFNIPAANDHKLEPLIVLTDAPIHFIRAYDRLDVMVNSPNFAAIRRSIAPFVWDLDTINADWPRAEYEKFRLFLAENCITSAAVLPVHRVDGERAAVMLLGDRDKLTLEELSELNLFIIHAYDLYNKLTNKKLGDEKLLTTRESEVLQWAANGKTSGEIGSILSISDHTVNSYMNAAMRKLDCVNRTQLVAKALRLHLIRYTV